MFLLVPAYLGSPGQKAVKRLCVCAESIQNDPANKNFIKIKVRKPMKSALSTVSKHYTLDNYNTVQEAPLSPSDHAMRLVSSNLANYHATVQKLLIRQVLTKPMV